MGNSALTGPSVYITIYSEEFGISSAEASGLISYANLAFGFGMSQKRNGFVYFYSMFSGSLLLVPMYLKIGRRPVTLLSMVTVRIKLKLDISYADKLQFLAGLIGASRCTTYSGLMIARIFHGFGR